MKPTTPDLIPGAASPEEPSGAAAPADPVVELARQVRAALVDSASAGHAEVLVVSPEEDLAAGIDRLLRNSVAPLHATWIAGLKDLQYALQQRSPGLVLCDGRAGLAPLDKVVAQCARAHSDLPVVAIGHLHSAADAVAAISVGAQDFVSFENPPLLRLVVVREVLRHLRLRDLRNVRIKLADSESRHHRLTEVTNDAIALVQEGIVANANAAFTSLLGFDDAAELAGTPLIDLVTPESRAPIRQRIRSLLLGKRNDEPLELVLAGRRQPVKVNARLILGNQEGESVIELLVRMADSHRRADAAAAAVFLGRGHYAEALAEALTASAGGDSAACSALLLRIDHFEALERQVGHAAAQDITAQLAQWLREHLTPRDRAFVFSTDELGLLVAREGFDPAAQLAETLTRQVAAHRFSTAAGAIAITITVAVLPMDGSAAPAEIINQLVEQARAASGRGGNQVMHLGASAKVRQAEQEIEARARQVQSALEQNRLYLAYQAVASLEGEASNHYDVLVRMRDDSGRELSAAEFLPAAQRFKLMRPIDRWVVARVLQTNAARADARNTSVMMVKLSEDTLKDGEGFVEWLRQLLQGGRPMSRSEIVFELQELAIQNHVGKAKALCAALREMGAGLAMEHFGVGANSTQLLAHIPADIVKFHHSYTNHFGDREIQKRLANLVEVARQRGIKTIVSHVEDARMMARLWQLGVNFVQGYHARQPEVVSLQGNQATWSGAVTLPFQ